MAKYKKEKEFKAVAITKIPAEDYNTLQKAGFSLATIGRQFFIDKAAEIRKGQKS